MNNGGISILSLNCWGLKYVSKRRKERLNAIAEKIAQENYDVVALQELWVYADYLNLRQKTQAKLGYGKYYACGVLGAGLAILSKFPIEASSMSPYRLNGRPIAFWRGDWYVGKGVASATLQHPSGCRIEVFNTHVRF